jgi:hypothetical protein
MITWLKHGDCQHVNHIRGPGWAEYDAIAAAGKIGVPHIGYVPCTGQYIFSGALLEKTPTGVRVVKGAVNA